MSIELKKIKRESEELVFEWSDNTTTKISLKALRDNCPCAYCQGEQVLFYETKPMRPEVLMPEAYELVSIELVGHYAVKPLWKDHHQTGLYPILYLYNLGVSE